MSYSIADAQAAAWTLDVDGEEGLATHPDGRTIAVTSSIPLFSLVANIAEAEGAGFAAGYGGDQAISAALVAAVSGETYAEQLPPPPAEDPPVSTSKAVDSAIAVAMAVVAITSPNLTTPQKQAIEQKVRAAATNALEAP